MSERQRRERKEQWTLLNACEDVVKMRPPSWDDGTNGMRQWRCRDVGMLKAILAWERENAADGTDAWWQGMCRVARAAQTVKQPLSVAIEHGVYLSGGPLKDSRCICITHAAPLGRGSARVKLVIQINQAAEGATRRARAR